MHGLNALIKGHGEREEGRERNRYENKTLKKKFCLLIGAFNPFAFIAIVDRYVFIAILLFIFFREREGETMNCCSPIHAFIGCFLHIP